MIEFKVYVEYADGTYLDEYTLWADSEDEAYIFAYERHSYADVTVYIEEKESGESL